MILKYIEKNNENNKETARRRVAAPSWVFPGAILENCLFLEGKVDEVCLLFLETESCLAYTRQELPPSLADLDLTWHVHLPADPPWAEGGETVAGVCSALLDKVAFLGVECAVLHPPERNGGEDARLLDAFALAWKKAGRSCCDVLLENIRENDLTGLGGCIAANAFGVCLDLGHMLGHRQTALAAMVRGERAPVWSAAPRMAHLNAPGSGLAGEAPVSAHLQLDALDADGLKLAEDLCRMVAVDGVLVAEFFNWRYVAHSLPLLNQWARSR